MIKKDAKFKGTKPKKSIKHKKLNKFEKIKIVSKQMMMCEVIAENALYEMAECEIDILHTHYFLFQLIGFICSRNDLSMKEYIEETVKIFNLYLKDNHDE
jgi:hypothetical protein